MADLYGPFDLGTFAQSQWYRDRGYLEPSGVAGLQAASAAAGELALTANGLTLSLGLGRAHMRGAAYERTGTAWTYATPANTNATQSRYDRVVLRRDLTAKTVVPAVLQGTPAATPVAPALTQVENGIWEEALFRVTVPPASGTVLVIVDERRFIAGGLLPAVAAGSVPSGWQMSNIVNAGFESFRCYLDAHGFVHPYGGVSNTALFTSAGNEHIATVPAGMRPRNFINRPVPLIVAGNARTVHVDVNPDSAGGTGAGAPGAVALRRTDGASIAANTIFDLGSIAPWPIL